MTRVSLFSAPFLLGFDTFEERFDRLARATEGYPPYNIERATAEAGDETYRIAVAVAGFSRNDLEVIGEDNQLIVRGRQTEDGARQYLHRGIAARQFQRSFVLAEGIEIVTARLDNGLLNIDLKRPQQANVVQTIEIATGKPDQTAKPEIELTSGRSVLSKQS